MMGHELLDGNPTTTYTRAPRPRRGPQEAIKVVLMWLPSPPCPSPRGKQPLAAVSPESQDLECRGRRKHSRFRFGVVIWGRALEFSAPFDRCNHGTRAPHSNRLGARSREMISPDPQISRRCCCRVLGVAESSSLPVHRTVRAQPPDCVAVPSLPRIPREAGVAGPRVLPFPWGLGVWE